MSCLNWRISQWPKPVCAIKKHFLTFISEKVFFVLTICYSCFLNPLTKPIRKMCDFELVLTTSVAFLHYSLVWCVWFLAKALPKKFQLFLECVLFQWDHLREYWSKSQTGPWKTIYLGNDIWRQYSRDCSSSAVLPEIVTVALFDLKLNRWTRRRIEEKEWSIELMSYIINEKEF